MKTACKEKTVVTVLVCLLALIVAVSAFMIIKMRSQNTDAYAVEIYQDTKLVETVYLADLEGERLIEIGTSNVVLVDRDGVYMHKADCPDKLCVKQGRIKAGQSIVCLPNRVSVKLIGADKSDVDIIAG